MKFNKERTAVKSPLTGLQQYELACAAGKLRKVVVPPSEHSAVPGIWEKVPVHELSWKETKGSEPLEVLAMRIRPRELVVDELTRHPNTDQVFVPITGPFMAVAGQSMADDPDSPSPEGLSIIPVQIGEAINIKAGTWHTLPFATTGILVCLSIMHRESLDTYHDLRDLVAVGWIAVPSWPDPDYIH
jgi:ureidoglycolate hydrolase